MLKLIQNSVWITLLLTVGCGSEVLNSSQSPDLSTIQAVQHWKSCPVSLKLQWITPTSKPLHSPQYMQIWHTLTWVKFNSPP